MPRLVGIQLDEWSEPLFIFRLVSEVEISARKFGFGEQAFKIAVRESSKVDDDAHAGSLHARGDTLRLRSNCLHLHLTTQ